MRQLAICYAHAVDRGGLHTSRPGGHMTFDNRPVASRLADWSEVRRLVGAMGRESRGVFELAFPLAGRSPDPAVRAQIRSALCELAAESGVPVTFKFARESKDPTRCINFSSYMGTGTNRTLARWPTGNLSAALSLT